jgi:hypothetical protein
MNINIGADECILWLRKNGKEKGIDNDVLGKRIRGLICDTLGGTLLPGDAAAYWDCSDGNKNISAQELPMTAAQYSLSVFRLSELYNELDKY